MNCTEHGYPTAAALRKLRKWDSTDQRGAFEYARSLWKWPEYVRQRGQRYTFITGGWSGNEEVIAALEANLIIHSICWQASFRGGKHVYELPSHAKTMRQYHAENPKQTKAKRARGDWTGYPTKSETSAILRRAKKAR